MRANLARHLVGGENATELKNLLFGFRWLLKRSQKAASKGIGDKEVPCIERDYEELSISMKSAQQHEIGREQMNVSSHESHAP